jgi:maltose O-acetyltransferase
MYLRNVMVNTIAPSALLTPRLRRNILRLAGLRVGRGVRLNSGTYIYGRQVSIGDRTFLNQGCLLDSSAPITLAADVFIGPRCVLTTLGHEIGGPDRRCGRRVRAPIRVGAGSWLGANVTVLSGVTIGTGCVVAAGAVVNRDCEPNGLYMGVPARRVRDLDGAERRSAQRVFEPTG